MWSPSRTQWAVIWTVAALIFLAWPPKEGRSFAVRAINWAADPTGSLPDLPPVLPMGLDDDGDAVSAHDAQEQDYYRAYDSGGLTRTRLRLKTMEDPFDVGTERQLLVGVGIAAALAIWQLETRRARRERRGSHGRKPPR
jgi:hypothetical protein